MMKQLITYNHGFVQLSLIVAGLILAASALITGVTVNQMSQGQDTRSQAIETDRGTGTPVPTPNNQTGTARGTITRPSSTPNQNTSPVVFKYSCEANGQCVRDEDGEYDSLRGCERECVSSIPAPALTKYSCTKDYQCIVSTSGNFSSQALCKAECQPPPPPSPTPPTLPLESCEDNAGKCISNEEVCLPSTTLNYNCSVKNQKCVTESAKCNLPTNCAIVGNRCCSDSHDGSVWCDGTDLIASSSNPNVCTCNKVTKQVCSTGERRCFNDSSLQTCTSSYAWSAPIQCTNGCDLSKTPPECKSPPTTKYSCNKDGSCVQNADGNFSSQTLCEAECKITDQVVTLPLTPTNACVDNGGKCVHKGFNCEPSVEITGMTCLNENEKCVIETAKCFTCGGLQPDSEKCVDEKLTCDYNGVVAGKTCPVGQKCVIEAALCVPANLYTCGDRSRCVPNSYLCSSETIYTDLTCPPYQKCVPLYSNYMENSCGEHPRGQYCSDKQQRDCVVFEGCIPDFSGGHCASTTFTDENYCYTVDEKSCIYGRTMTCSTDHHWEQGDSYVPCTKPILLNNLFTCNESKQQECDVNNAKCVHDIFGIKEDYCQETILDDPYYCDSPGVIRCKYSKEQVCSKYHRWIDSSPVDCVGGCDPFTNRCQEVESACTPGDYRCRMPDIYGGQDRLVCTKDGKWSSIQYCSSGCDDDIFRGATCNFPFEPSPFDSLQCVQEGNFRCGESGDLEMCSLADGDVKVWNHVEDCQYGCNTESRRCIEQITQTPLDTSADAIDDYLRSPNWDRIEAECTPATGTAYSVIVTYDQDVAKYDFSDKKDHSTDISNCKITLYGYR